MAKVSKKGSSRELQKFIQAKILLLLKLIPEEAAKAMQEQGYRELQILSSAFGNEQYFDEKGKARGMLKFKKQWGTYKKLHARDRRRGHAKGTLAKAASRRSVLRKIKGGYRFDITRASKRIRPYWGDFQENKTLGNWLATLKKGWPARHRKIVRKRLEPLMKALVKLGFDTKGKVDIVMQLESVIKRLPKRVLPQNARRRRL